MCWAALRMTFRVLVANGLLKPLGNPTANAVKYFARVTLQELSDDVKWTSAPDK